MKRLSVSNLLTLFLFGASMLVAAWTAFVAGGVGMADRQVLSALGWSLAMVGSACVGVSVFFLLARLLKLGRD